MASLLKISARRRLRFHGGASSIMPLYCNDDDDGNTFQSTRDCSRRRATTYSLSSSHTNRNRSSSSSFLTPTRHNYYYHTTTRTEILPIILAGSVIIGAGIYTYRALEQMDIDAIEYQTKLEEYEALNSYMGGTMAIDVGTARFKLSHCSKSMIVNVDGTSSNENNAKVLPPIVCVDREGYRSTPSSIWVLPPGGSGGEEMPLFGRMAEARCYDKRHGTIVQPRSILLDSGSSNTQQTINNNDDDAMIVRHAIRVVAKNALDQVLGESSEAGGNVMEEEGIMDNNNNNNNDKPLFVRSATVSGSYDVRPIFTYPPSSSITTTYGTGNDEYIERYRNIVSKLTSPNNIGMFVSEPIAVVVGAEYYGLLPPESKNNSGASSVLVVDVGGTSTVVSLVVKEDVTYSVTLPFGGNTHINLLVSLLIDNFFGQVSGDINNNSNKNEDDNADTQLGSKPILNDPAALQRLHDASISAIHELSSKTRTNINVPYLSMDATTRQPRHLELDMSRNVVDATVESWIGTKLVPHLQSLSAQSDQSVLSSALPPPTDLTTLLSSIIAHILERTSLNTPFALRAILLVGGGARIPLVRESMTQCVKYLAGDAYTSERLIMPEGEMGDELAVLGAAVWGSRRG